MKAPGIPDQQMDLLAARPTREEWAELLDECDVEVIHGGKRINAQEEIDDGVAGAGSADSGGTAPRSRASIRSRSRASSTSVRSSRTIMRSGWR